MGRLRPGWNLGRTSAWLGSVTPGIIEATAPVGYSPELIRTFRSYRLAAYPASHGVSWLRWQYESSLWLLLGITGLVLLIACTNLGNLMLARASARQHATAVRLALGASRRRLLAQLMVESVLLAFLGAAAGIGLAQLLSHALVRVISTSRDFINLTVATDWRVLLFSAGAALVTCLVLAWRLRSAPRELNHSLP